MTKVTYNDEKLPLFVPIVEARMSQPQDVIYRVHSLYIIRCDTSAIADDIDVIKRRR